MKRNIFLILLSAFTYLGCSNNNNTSMEKNYAQKIDSLLLEINQKIDAAESKAFNLGRPELNQIADIDKLIKEGNNAIPYILPYLNESQPKRVAYLVHAISMIDKKSIARVNIESIREKLLSKQSKNEWDFAAIGECNLMLDSTR